MAAPAIRAALDIASAPPAERVGVAEAVKARYGVAVKPTTDSLIPFLPVPMMPSATYEMDAQLRTFRAVAGSQ